MAIRRLTSESQILNIIREMENDNSGQNTSRLITNNDEINSGIWNVLAKMALQSANGYEKSIILGNDDNRRHPETASLESNEEEL